MRITFEPNYMFTDKLGGIELPYSHNIKSDENHKLCAIYAIPENKIKTIQVFCILSNAERIIYSRKCIFDDILGKLWLFKKS